MPVLNAWISVSSWRAGSAVRCMILSRPSCWTVPSHRMIFLSSVTIWSWTVAPGGAGISRRSGPLLSMIESIRGRGPDRGFRGSGGYRRHRLGRRRVSRLRCILLCEDARGCARIARETSPAPITLNLASVIIVHTPSVSVSAAADATRAEDPRARAFAAVTVVSMSLGETAA